MGMLLLHLYQVNFKKPVKKSPGHILQQKKKTIKIVLLF